MKQKKQYYKTFIKSSKLNYCLGLFFTILKASFNIFFAFLMQIVVNFALSDDLDELPLLLVLSIASLLFYGISIYLKLLFQNKFYFNVLANYKVDLHKSIISKDLVSFRKKSIGSYLSIMTNDINSIELNYLENIFVLPEQLFLLFGSMIAMVFSNWIFFLVIVLSSLLPIVSTMIYAKQIKSQEKQIADKNGNFMATVKDMLSGFTVIKSFRIEDEISRVFEGLNGSLEFAKLKKRHMLSVVETASEVSSIFLFIIVFLVGSILTITGYMEIGTVVAFVQLLNYIVEPIGKLPQVLNKMRASKYLIGVGTDLINEEDTERKDRQKIIRFDDKISLDEVSFSYYDENVLKNVSAEFKSGKSYALVGMSGSGKSTLLNLLMGYYDSYKGSIKLDDLELSDIDLESLYEYVSVVQQDVFIFDDNIISNITMHKDFSQEQVTTAMDKAGLTKLVEERGLEYQCGENGNRLSGGEKQRISIARCLLKETPILLLDEAMSALDNTTAKQIEEAILSISGITRIVITHKLNADVLKRYDGIITMKDGKVAEVGNFDDLMDKRGLFYSIYTVSGN